MIKNGLILNDEITKKFALIIICGFFCEILQIFCKKSKKKIIPVCVSLFGATISLLSHVFCPDLLETKNILEAVAVGIISGLASSGSDELIKKLLKKGEKNE